MILNNYRLILSILVVMVLGGCASAPVAINQKDQSSLHGSKLTVIHYEPDSFLPMTNAKGAFAIVGVAAAVSEGKKLVVEHGLVDPAIGIKEVLTDKLSESYNISDITFMPEILPYESSPEKVASLVSNTGYVLDVRTFGWGTMYYPFKTKYKVNYMAQARLINAKENRIISAERCLINEKYSENSPTYQQLMDNGAVLLKQKLEEAKQECTTKFINQMIGNSTAVSSSSR